MKFRSLFIKGFGIYDGSIPADKRFFKFEPKGINVITGRNERGKTTLMEALMDTLYGIPERRRNLRNPWGEHGEFSAVLEFSVKDNYYKIDRNFHSHHTVLSDCTGDKEIIHFKGKANPRGTGRSSREFVKTLETLGIPSRNVIEQLSFVRLLQLDKGVANEIRRLITGGGVADYQSIIDDLKDEYFKITRFDAWKSTNKRKLRQLEELEKKYLELKKRYEESLTEHRDILTMEEDNRELRKKIPQLENRVKDGKLLKDRLNEAIRINEDFSRVKEKLNQLMEQKNKILEKQHELEELRERILEGFKAFEDFDGEVEKSVHNLEKYRENVTRRKTSHKVFSEKIEKLTTEKEKVEKHAREKYKDLIDLDESFIEDLNSYLLNSNKNREDIAYYCEKKAQISKLESSMDGKPIEDDGRDPDEMSEKIISYREEEKQAKIEIQRLKEVLHDIVTLEESLDEVENVLYKDFKYYDKLPDDIEYRLKEYLAAIKDREDKCGEIEKINERIHKLNKEINNPLNYVLPGLLLLIFFITGNFAKDLIVGFYLGSFGFLAGLLLVWLRIKKHYYEKNKQEALFMVLEPVIKMELPDNGIPKSFPKNIEYNKILKNYPNYIKSCKAYDKIVTRLQDMEQRKVVEKRIEDIEEKLLKHREEIGINPGEDPSYLVDDLRRTRHQVDNIKMMRKILTERFPVLPETGELPDLPQDVVDNIKKQEDFEKKYPFVKNTENPGTIKTDFEAAKSLMAKISELDTRISQIKESDTGDTEIDKAEAEKLNLAEQLKPLLDIYDDDLQKISEEFRKYTELKNKEKSLKFWLDETGDVFTLDNKIVDLSGDAVILDRRKSDLMDKSSLLRSLLVDDVKKASLQLRNVESEVEKAQKELFEKKEKLNINLYRIEQYNKHNEDPMSLQEDLEELKHSMEKLKFQRDSYQTAIDVLIESTGEFYKSYGNMLEQNVANIFSRMTGDKYQKVVLDESFNLFVDDVAAEPVDKQHLSTGTLDQLYFAVRIALAEGLSDLIYLPFLLDDPFVYFDSGRLEAARVIMENISQEHQIILFSHNPDYAEWGDNVRNLDKLLG